MQRLVVVSNRVPAASRKPAAGGLAVAMETALRDRGGLWFGWSGETVQGEVGETHRHERNGIVYATVDLGEANHHGYYEGYSNQTLWPLFHHRVDLTVFDRGLFEHYETVNSFFAERLAKILEPDDVIWVQDYHLIPLGEALRRLGCRQRIGFFLHTPFPAPEILVTLFNHKRLIRSLLAYDLVGFQTEGDLRSFRNYVERELRGGKATAEGQVSAYGETTRAAAFPIGIDPKTFQTLANSPSARRYRERVKRSLNDCDLILSIDRLDYTKGLPERMAAVELLFDRHGEHCGRVSFLQIASPSRSDVPQYQTIRAQLESAVGKINGHFAHSDWTPARYVSRTYSQTQLCGLYPLGKVGLVTPLRDGMNLVAKEYVASQEAQDPGVLVLSRFAGAAQQLEGALLVNPYDTVDVADAIHRALKMPTAERIKRWTSMMENLEREDLTGWRDAFLNALAPDAEAQA